MKSHLTTFVSYLYLLTCLLLQRKFPNAIYGIVEKTKEIKKYLG